jgi:hypothetical protein
MLFMSHSTRFLRWAPALLLCPSLLPLSAQSFVPVSALQPSISAARPMRLTPTLELNHPLPHKDLWIASLVALGAVNVLDVVSSMGQRELNPLLQTSSGSFGARSVAVKASIVGGSMVLQRLVLRRDPKHPFRRMAITNFISAGVLGGVVAHNFEIRKR